MSHDYFWDDCTSNILTLYIFSIEYLYLIFFQFKHTNFFKTFNQLLLSTFSQFLCYLMISNAFLKKIVIATSNFILCQKKIQVHPDKKKIKVNILD